MKWTSPIRGIEPRAAAVKSFGLKGGDVSRYTISDAMVNIIPLLTIQANEKDSLRKTLRKTMSRCLFVLDHALLSFAYS